MQIKIGNIIRDLRQLADDLQAIITPKKETKEISIEEVRAVLAEKSQAGKQPEVKALITKFGAVKLTDIDPEKYAELLLEAEAL